MSGEIPLADIGAIILAAGSSSRMGHPKQLLQFQGMSLLRRAALAAIEAGCHPVVVVTGANAELFRGELNGLPVQDVVNNDWQSGMASSVRTGIEALVSCAPDASAAIFLLCDQPHVNGEVVSRLVAAHQDTESLVVASAYGGSFGVPALFGRSLFAELAGLDGGAGAKQVIKRHMAAARFIPFADGEIDVDTPDDFSRLTETSARQTGSPR